MSDVLDFSEGYLGELNGFEGWLEILRPVSLMSEDEEGGLSVATAFSPSCLTSPCLLSPSAPPSIFNFTVLLSVPIALLAVHS